MNIQNLPLSLAFGFTKQKKLKMQDLLLRDVRKLRKTFLSQYRMTRDRQKITIKERICIFDTLPLSISICDAPEKNGLTISDV